MFSLEKAENGLFIKEYSVNESTSIVYCPKFNSVCNNCTLYRISWNILVLILKYTFCTKVYNTSLRCLSPANQVLGFTCNNSSRGGIFFQ